MLLDNEKLRYESCSLNIYVEINVWDIHVVD